MKRAFKRSITDGGYEITHTTGGTYKVEFRLRGDDLNYIPQFYNNKRYWGQADLVFTGAMPTQRCEKTNDAGGYAFGGLEAAQYKAMFSVELRGYVHQIPPLNPDPNGYLTIYWSEKSTWEEAEVITLAAPTTAIANARLGFPASAKGESTATSAQPQPALTPSRRHCRPGFTRKKIKDKYRCARRFRRHRRHHRAPKGAGGDPRC